jgi:hypothetical protein
MPVKVNNRERKDPAQLCVSYLKEKKKPTFHPRLSNGPIQNTNRVLDENPVNLKRILEIQKNIST